MPKILFNCSNCGADMEVAENLPGTLVDCPKCQHGVLAPHPGLKPETIIGDFKLLRRLGTGGMGDVWLAYQDTMDRHVALKILSPTLTDDEKFVSRFLQEVKISAKLHHPNIVTSFYAGVHKGIYYLAISFVDGHGLDEIMANRGIIDETVALDICIKIADALKYAWNKFKIVHRDIKPANIMISREEEDVHLMDMGISKNLTEDSALTLTGMIIGTPYYMSPEQARGDVDLDCRADIYALGSTLYHMVAGEVPYDSTHTIGILTKLISDPFPDPREKNPGLSDACALLLEKMMQKNARDRQQSWEEVIRDLKKVASDENSGKTAEIPRPQQPAPPLKKENANVTASPCPSCGKGNKVDSLFCVQCGKSLTQECPECGQKVSVLMNFCSKCGVDIKIILQLKIILDTLKKEHQEQHWQKLADLCCSLPEKKELTAKKAAEILTEILRLKSEAEKNLQLEKAYEKADVSAKALADQGKNIEAMNALQDFLNEYPKNDYSPEIIHRINKLKRSSYQGPEPGDELLVEGANLNMVPIEPGEFLMGSPAGGFLGIGGEKGRQKNESPQHLVRLTSPFWIGKYPVTIAEYLFFLNCPDNQGELEWTPVSCSMDQAGAAHDCWSDPQKPIVEISWLEATNFCKWLTSRETKYNRLPEGYIFRLPTEAEWEYCCRAGSTTGFHFGDSDEQLPEYAWYKRNSEGKSHPVGQKNPNTWGLYDMIGNVWEWCHDKYGDYSASEALDPFGSTFGFGFVRRGGSWINDADRCRSASRNYWDAKCAYNYLGFRLALAPAKIHMRGTPI